MSRQQAASRKPQAAISNQQVASRKPQAASSKVAARCDVRPVPRGYFRLQLRQQLALVHHCDRLDLAEERPDLQTDQNQCKTDQNQCKIDQNVYNMQASVQTKINFKIAPAGWKEPHPLSPPVPASGASMSSLARAALSRTSPRFSGAPWRPIIINTQFTL